MANGTSPPKSPFVMAHEAAAAQYEKLMEGREQLDALRVGLDKLLKLGDMVGPDDVVKEASNLVAKGLDPHELAVMLSSMPPQGGEMLQAWISMHDQDVAGMEQRATGIIAQARTRMMTAAGHVLMEDHMNQTGQPASPQQTAMAPQAGMAGPPPAAPPGLTPNSPVMGSA